MKIAHKIAPSEIAHGNVLITKTDGMHDFFRQLETFDVISEWGSLYERRVGNQNIWFGRVFMRNFNPDDYMVFENVGKSKIRVSRHVRGSLTA